MIKKTIPIGPLVINEHTGNSVKPVDIQQMIEHGLSFWAELDRKAQRIKI